MRVCVCVCVCVYTDEYRFVLMHIVARTSGSRRCSLYICICVCAPCMYVVGTYVDMQICKPCSRLCSLYKRIEVCVRVCVGVYVHVCIDQTDLYLN